MKLLTTIAAVLISISAFSQEKLIFDGGGIKGQETITFTTSYYGDEIILLNSLSPEALHFICALYQDKRLNFEYEKDLIATMSGYLEDEEAAALILTKSEKKLLKKYKEIQFAEWKKSKIKPSNNISSGDHLQRAGRYKNASIAILFGSGTTAYALIAADPINGPTASIIAVAGGIASLGLNIAGNMELIAAGKAENRP